MGVASAPTSTSSSSSSAADKRRVILIRHGEKPRHGKPGLSKKGKKRARCVRKVSKPVCAAQSVQSEADGLRDQLFGSKRSKYNVTAVMAQGYNPHGSGARMRPYLTVRKLAQDLGVEVDLDCERDAPKCVKRKVDRWLKHGTGDMLICWVRSCSLCASQVHHADTLYMCLQKHSEMASVAKALGAETAQDYPDSRYDIMWIMKDGEMVHKESEQCPGLDERWRTRHGRKDPDLELPAPSRHHRHAQGNLAASRDSSQDVHDGSRGALGSADSTDTRGSADDVLDELEHLEDLDADEDEDDLDDDEAERDEFVIQV